MRTALLLLLLLPGSVAALGVMSWNTLGAEDAPRALAARVERALAAVGAVDVLVLQEIVSQAQVEAVARAAGFPYHAISDFSPPVERTDGWYQSLEVAVLSRIPIQAVAEWDSTGRGTGGDGYPPRVVPPSTASRELALAPPRAGERPSRGFLRVDLEGGLSVYAVHWKSTSGRDCSTDDLGFARQRETQALAVRLDARERLAAGYDVLVAGDFNIQGPGPGATPRVGTDPDEDCAARDGCGGCGPGGRDGYDDSIALLLGMDPSARLLTAALGPTYIARRFPGGAIDHIVVAGRGAARFAPAVAPEARGGDWFGSDHLPVLARTRDERGAAAPRAGFFERALDGVSALFRRLAGQDEDGS